MLEHADAGHLVVDRLALQVAVILQFDAAPVLESRPRDALPRHLELLGAQGHAMCPHAVALRRMDHERAPAASDVEKSLSRLQRQLAADMLELRLLGGAPSQDGPLELGAGIHHCAVQPQYEDLLR